MTLRKLTGFGSTVDSIFGVNLLQSSWSILSNITDLAVGFKEEIGSEEEPTSSDRVVIIEDDEITEEGNKETIE